MYFNLISHGNDKWNFSLKRPTTFKILGNEALIITGYKDIKFMAKRR